jgi:hypothetical protein
MQALVARVQAASPNFPAAPVTAETWKHLLLLALHTGDARVIRMLVSSSGGAAFETHLLPWEHYCYECPSAPSAVDEGAVVRAVQELFLVHGAWFADNQGAFMPHEFLGLTRVKSERWDLCECAVRLNHVATWGSADLTRSQARAVDVARARVLEEGVARAVTGVHAEVHAALGVASTAPRTWSRGGKFMDVYSRLPEELRQYVSCTVARAALCALADEARSLDCNEHWPWFASRGRMVVSVFASAQGKYVSHAPECEACACAPANVYALPRTVPARSPTPEMVARWCAGMTVGGE